MNFNRNKITLLTFSVILFLFTACTKDNDLPVPTNDTFISIPDSYFETKLIAQGIDTDGIVNQKILKTDAEQTTRLDLNFAANFGEIANLKGIEAFVNLTFLSAANQKIESVDLHSNTKLDTIYLLGNLLTDIDLSHNSDLIFVDLQANRFNPNSTISGLEVATNLKDLDLSWNYLETFSIQNASLEILHISHNDLKSLNTTGAVNLKNIYMPSNKLETVNFTKNTALETLLVSGNKLQNVNIGNNTKLTHFYISSNELTSLDVGNNQALIDLRIDRNPNLTCIKIENGQQIPMVSKSVYQELNDSCN